MDKDLNVDELQRYRGAMLGLAAGDALGTTLEFTEPPCEPIDDIVGGGPFGLEPGEWTDDTSLALCLAESLIERRGFDPVDQLSRYVRWYRDGHLSSNGHCFDIGITTRAALHRFEETSEPYPGSTDPGTAGNGSLMRLAPVPLFYGLDCNEAIARAADSSRTTHGAPASVDACRYFAGLIVGALRSVAKDELLSPSWSPVPDLWEQEPLVEEIADVAAGSFRHKEPPEIQGSGYVVRSLEAALWAFAKAGSFKEGCLLAVNLFDDADTTGAIYGQLAGAYYGEQAIPTTWRKKLAHRGLIEEFGARLFDLRPQGTS